MHPAQAPDNAPAWYDRARFHRPTTPLAERGRPIGLGVDLDGTTAEPATEDRRRPHLRTLPSETDLLCPPRRLAVGSYPPTPGGSQRAFPPGHVCTPHPPPPLPPFLPPPALPPPPHRLTLRRAYPRGRATGLPRCSAGILVG